MYGLSGASGTCYNEAQSASYYFCNTFYTSLICRHNCLWCLITRSKLAEPKDKRGSYAARSLDSLKADYARFTSQGHGNRSLAKEYNNVIGAIILDIPIDNVKKNFLKETDLISI